MGKILKFIVWAGAAVIVADIALVIFVAHYRPAIEKSDAVIVLGAAINTPALYNRTLTGLHLYESGLANTMVLSGGRISDRDISEAEYMQKVVRQNADDVLPSMILEEDSHSTYENLKNSQARLSDADTLIVVSDQFHLARGVIMARRLGFRRVSWAAPEPTYYKKEELIRYYLREMAAMLAYIPHFLRG